MPSRTRLVVLLTALGISLVLTPPLRKRYWDARRRQAIDFAEYGPEGRRGYERRVEAATACRKLLTYGKPYVGTRERIVGPMEVVRKVTASLTFFHTGTARHATGGCWFHPRYSCDGDTPVLHTSYRGKGSAPSRAEWIVKGKSFRLDGEEYRLDDSRPAEPDPKGPLVDACA